MGYHGFLGGPLRENVKQRCGHLDLYVYQIPPQQIVLWVKSHSAGHLLQEMSVEIKKKNKLARELDFLEFIVRISDQYSYVYDMKG